MNLDDMIAAERSAPAQATPTQADEVWKSIESSFVSVLPPAGAPLAAAKASTLGKFGAALTSTTGKLLLATSLVAGGVMTGRGLGEADRETPSVQRSPRGREAASPAVSAPPAVASTLPEAQPISAPAPEPEPEPES